ncbi:MAG: bile acid:sodium symporter [Solirubrobacterales bacterium]|nr:bile acid:sodium symporter [Solirubrobacterales bacterium]MCB8969909.1 bile acid:sodium symporter [Thermoleophilales bacterium]
MEDSVLATVVLPAALAVIMLSLGLSLTTADFKRVAVQPRGIAVGIANLALISPLLALAIAELYSLEPAFAVGLVLLGASPGGTMANLLTHLARGDTALSISMTAISSLAAIVTVPLFLQLSTSHFGATELDESVDMLGVVVRVLVITVIPLGVGMWFRERWPQRVSEIEGTVKKVAFGVFLAVVVGVVIAEFDRVSEHLWEVAPAVVTLNVAAMGISFGIARLARLDDRQATAIAIELGVHNSTLAIAVGATIASVLTIPAAVYASFMFVTAGIFARLMYKRNAATARVVAG